MVDCKPFSAHEKNGRHKDSAGGERLDLTGNWVGIASVLLFFVAYLAVMAEEFSRHHSGLSSASHGATRPAGRTK